MTASASASPAEGSASPQSVPKSPADWPSQDATPEYEHAHAQGAGSASPNSNAESIDREEGEIDGQEAEQDAPPLPSEPVPGSSGPPLPNEPIPQADDGWDCQWDPSTQAWFFYNRFTGKSQWENPREPSANGAEAAAPASSAPPSDSAAPTQDIVLGYNPAIHGDYDPNAWYAQKYTQPDEPVAPEIPSLADEPYGATAAFNRFTGQFQTADAGPGRHSDEAKSKRQMNAFFDVDAAANADDGRSLKAERSNKRISKSELKAFKEKRRARKEEKRRAWLRD